MKPDFLWVGLGKSGSSLTFRVLSRHPGIHLGARKEHGFFVDPARYARGEAYYDTHLAGAAPGQITGDITPGYYSDDERLDRILAFYGPDALPKVIFCMRNPVEFAVSRYHHVLKVGRFFDRGPYIPRDINHFTERLYARPAYLRDRLRAVADRLGGPENICLLIYEEDFSGAYDFETRIYRHLGLSAETRYYDPATDGAVYSGVRPHFILPQPTERVLEFSGHPYAIPADTAVFCSLPGHGRLFPAPAPDQIRKMQRANEEWNAPLRDDLMARIHEDQTRPLLAYMREAFGRDVTGWSSRATPRAYPQALPPKTLRLPAVKPASQGACHVRPENQERVHQAFRI